MNKPHCLEMIQSNIKLWLSDWICQPILVQNTKVKRRSHFILISHREGIILHLTIETEHVKVNLDHRKQKPQLIRTFSLTAHVRVCLLEQASKYQPDSLKSAELRRIVGNWRMGCERPEILKCGKSNCTLSASFGAFQESSFYLNPQHLLRFSFLINHR